MSPLELAMIQQQRRSLGPLEAFRWISQTHGPWALLHGLEITALREAIYTGGYLALSPALTKLIADVPGWDFQLANMMIGSCVAGVVAAVLTHPVDTVKTF